MSVDRIRRRLMAGAAALPLALPSHVGAQAPAHRPLIAYLGGAQPDATVQRNMIDPFVAGLRELGHVDGQNVTLVYRWADGQPERLPALLAQLVAMKPDVLIAAGPRPAQMARDAARDPAWKIPVVAVAVDDPVLTGLAASIARPGGHITGLSGGFDGILEKRLQLLKHIVPKARGFAVLMNPLTAPPGMADWASKTERQLGAPLMLASAREPEEFGAAFDDIVARPADAVAILADATFFRHRARLGELCSKHRLPAAVGGRGYLDLVGLVSYQGDFGALFRRAGSFVDKILKGTKPGEIPFEQSTKLELVVSLKAARALGVHIPATVLVAADEVIE